MKKRKYEIPIVKFELIEDDELLTGSVTGTVSDFEEGEGDPDPVEED